MKNNLVILFLLFFFLSCSADDITQSKPSIEASDEAIFNNSNQEDPESENNPDEENPENPAFNSDENKPPLNEPYIYDHFTTNSGIWDLQKFLPGEIKFEASNVQMQINGDPDLGPYDKVGPGFANQISTKEPLSYGRYQVYVKAAPCNADEEVITGIFIYAHGGDKNNNNIDDNDEIDIEFTCSSPHIIWMTIWTDYTDNSSFRKITRKINMETGEFFQTPPGKEDTWEISWTPDGTIEEITYPNFDFTNKFYEMGFEWQPNYVRYFLIIDNVEYTLWKMSKVAFIPNPTAQFMVNIWHSSGQWDTGNTGDFPKNDTSVYVDWFKYWDELL